MPADRDDGRDNRWVTIDVAIATLGINRRRAYQLAKAEGWHNVKPPGMRERQYSFADILRTYNHRKATT